MIDLESIAIGMGIMLAILYTMYQIMSIRREPVEIIIEDPTGEAGRNPFCPDCGGYDLSLQDNNDGVPWLKGHTTEIDYYLCNECGRRFDDEDWESAKKYLRESQ